MSLQRVLEDPAWLGRRTDTDRRATTPLFGPTSAPYGRLEPRMDQRLDLDLPAASGHRHG